MMKLEDAKKAVESVLSHPLLYKTFEENLEDYVLRKDIELTENTGIVYRCGKSDIDWNWKHVYGSNRNISFCKIGDFWEFYKLEDDGVIKYITSIKVKGFGRANPIAKTICRMSNAEFYVSKVSGIWRIK